MNTALTSTATNDLTQPELSRKRLSTVCRCKFQYYIMHTRSEIRKEKRQLQVHNNSDIAGAYCHEKRGKRHLLRIKNVHTAARIVCTKIVQYSENLQVLLFGVT
jgi:hypothetical protein